VEKLSGLVLDVYDDPSGEVLRSIFPQYGELPEVIKTAHLITPEERDTLPDDLFGVILVDGAVELRKYACVDAGNTALSVEYFMQLRDKLPEEAQKVAAARLCTMCDWYGFDPPEELQKVAKGVIKKVVRGLKGYVKALRGHEGSRFGRAIEMHDRRRDMLKGIENNIVDMRGGYENLSPREVKDLARMAHSRRRGAAAAYKLEALKEKAEKSTRRARAGTAAAAGLTATGLTAAGVHHTLKKKKDEGESKEAGLLSWGAKKAVQNPLGTALTAVTAPAQIKGIGQTAGARGREAKASGAIINPEVLKAQPFSQ
jgi:hypothetical protein